MNPEIAQLKARIEEGREVAKNEGKSVPFWETELKLAIVGYLQESGLSRTEYAKLLGINVRVLSYWINGEALGTARCWRGWTKHKESSGDEPTPDTAYGSTESLSCLESSGDEPTPDTACFLTFDVTNDERTCR